MRGINMVTVYDVPAEQLILKTAQKLKENPNIVPPEWAEEDRQAHREGPHPGRLVVH